MAKRYIEADEFEKRIKPYDTDDPVDKAMYNFALNKMLCTPTAEVVPWKFLERYADWFCGSCSHAEFVRMAKLFWERENGEREETDG